VKTIPQNAGHQGEGDVHPATIARALAEKDPSTP